MNFLKLLLRLINPVQPLLPKADCSVNWAFIQEQEGFLCTGYVPKNSEASGVTVGAGFDLGQRGISNLQQIGLTPALQAKLQPYLGIKGFKARNFLLAHPLTLNADEIKDMQEKVNNFYYLQCESEYNANSDYTFCMLPGQIQTAIVSIFYQYGTLKNKAPKFFEYVTKGMWKMAVAELNNFGDAFSTRRKAEAAMMQSGIPST